MRKQTNERGLLNPMPPPLLNFIIIRVLGSDILIKTTVVSLYPRKQKV